MIYRLFYERDDAGPEVEREMSRKLMQMGFLQMYGLHLEKIRLERNALGKPFAIDYPEIHFNLSHCAGCSALIFGDGPVGVDVERIRPHKAVVRRALSPEEMRLLEASGFADEVFFTFWTLKECYGKAVGAGLLAGMKNLSFSFEHDVPRLLDHQEAVFFLAPPGHGVVTAACRLEGKRSAETWTPVVRDITDEDLIL